MYRILPMKVMMRSTVAAGNLFVQEWLEYVHSLQSEQVAMAIRLRCGRPMLHACRSPCCVGRRGRDDQRRRCVRRTKITTTFDVGRIGTQYTRQRNRESVPAPMFRSSCVSSTPPRLHAWVRQDRRGVFRACTKQQSWTFADDEICSSDKRQETTQPATAACVWLYSFVTRNAISRSTPARVQCRALSDDWRKCQRRRTVGNVRASDLAVWRSEDALVARTAIIGLADETEQYPAAILVPQVSPSIGYIRYGLHFFASIYLTS